MKKILLYNRTLKVYSIRQKSNLRDGINVKYTLNAKNDIGRVFEENKIFQIKGVDKKYYIVHNRIVK